jgi:phosphoglycerate dehydrogenase-like enzyme
MSDIVNILITLPFSQNAIDRLMSVSDRINILVDKAHKADEIPLEVWSQIEVLYTNRVLPSPDLAPNLRWIQFHWAGIDHAVNAPILHKPNLITTTLSGASATQVVEYIVMMLLSLGHNFPEMISAQRRGEWPKDKWERFRPLELRGSTVGIVGYGSIGRQLARVLKSFDARVLAIKRDAMHPEDNGYIPDRFGDPHGDFVDLLFPPEAIGSMLKECDFVVITVPLTPDTTNMINKKTITEFKPSAFLVDISRGGVIDHVAMIDALKERKLAGAAIDVFPVEPLPEDSPLWKIQNVIITPHISGNSPHYDERAVDLFIENIKRYLSNQNLYNQFDPRQGY